MHLEYAAAKVAADRHRRDVTQPHRLAAHRSDHALFEIVTDAAAVRSGNGPFVAWPGTQPADAAHQILGVGFFNHLPADGGVGCRHRPRNHSRRQAGVGEALGVELDLIFHHTAADAGHFGYAGHGGQLAAHVPVLNRPQTRQVVALTLDRVPEDLPDGRAVGCQKCLDARRQPIAGTRQPFADLLSGKIKVDSLLQEDAQRRKVKLARRTHHAHSRQPLQAGGERIGDLIFEFPRTMPRPLREDHDLVFRDVGNRVHRRVVDGVDPGQREHHRRCNYHRAVANRKLDDAVDHERGSRLEVRG